VPSYILNMIEGKYSSDVSAELIAQDEWESLTKLYESKSSKGSRWLFFKKDANEEIYWGETITKNSENCQLESNLVDLSMASPGQNRSDVRCNICETKNEETYVKSLVEFSSRNIKVIMLDDGQVSNEL